ncbi:hypothetical protein ATM98_02505 [Streptococcus sp. A12]|uniref:hypothetical protein n=1 Tax=Streptococcus sp. A12 TaxID=1759399 RepID=UPI0007791E3E|nr:hypothetical protein [Streptococcus sp. A12]AMP66649.1 hypothetical protein ATM98_02505 [Streptococcus sp. A12]
MEENNQLILKGHQLNNLSNHHLQDVISMAIAEKKPVELAWNNYYYASEREQYNDYLFDLGLTQYQITNSMIGQKLPFSQKDVEEAIHNRINENISMAENRLAKLDKSWKNDSKIFLENLKAENPEYFLDWSKEQISKTKSPGFFTLSLSAMLSGLVLLYIFYLNVYGMGGSWWNFFQWVLEPLISLVTLEFLEYPFLSFSFFVGFVIAFAVLLTITSPLTISLWEKFVRDPSAESKSKKIANDRYIHSQTVLKEYTNKPLSEFIEKNVYNQLITDAIPTDYLNKLINDYNKNIELLKTTDAWKNRYPKAAIKKVFKLNEKLSTALQDYNNRIENGTSMIALLPKSYHDSKSLSVIWQLLNEGRADTWKESVNLMKTDQFQDQMLYTINNLYQSVDNLSSQLANDGKKLRESLEFSIQQQHSHYSELKQSNSKQNTLLEQNNKLLETQNNMTSALLMSELISR